MKKSLSAICASLILGFGSCFASTEPPEQSIFLSVLSSEQQSQIMDFARRHSTQVSQAKEQIFQDRTALLNLIPSSNPSHSDIEKISQDLANQSAIISEYVITVLNYAYNIATPEQQVKMKTILTNKLNAVNNRRPASQILDASVIG